ncbi:MAG: zinc finger domain-containing protein, partial [Corynebacterium variabile]
VHPRKKATAMRQTDVMSLLDAATEVMTRALAAGGTTFDDLYVNVNGASGYFSRSLNVYGREGEPCPRCGTPVVREQWTNRSSHFCPECQRR